MIDPVQLVAVARRLNTGEDGRQPSAEAIRRAVSTAYYALFHRVLHAGATRFAGTDPTSAAYEVIYRSFDHGQIGRVLVAVDRPTLPDAYQKRLRRTAVSQAARDFAAVFVPMQELRHLADYSPSTLISQTEAEQLIDNVETALTAFENIDAREQADLLALMLVAKRGS